MEKKEHWEKEWEITPVYNQVSFIKYLLDKAREEGRKEILEEIDKLPKHEKNNSIGTVRYISLSELKSKLTTK